MNWLDETKPLPELRETYRFVIPAVPIAQPRQQHRVVQSGNRTFASNFTPVKHPVNAFKATVRQRVQSEYDGAPLDGPLSVRVNFVMPRPKKFIWKRRPMPRMPHDYGKDLDNLAKSVLDALNELLWRDDSQICELMLAKCIAAGDEAPHVELEVTAL